MPLLSEEAECFFCTLLAMTADITLFQCPQKGKIKIVIDPGSLKLEGEESYFC